MRMLLAKHPSLAGVLATTNSDRLSIYCLDDGGAERDYDGCDDGETGERMIRGRSSRPCTPSRRGVDDGLDTVRHQGAYGSDDIDRPMRSGQQHSEILSRHCTSNKYCYARASTRKQGNTTCTTGRHRSCSSGDNSREDESSICGSYRCRGRRVTLSQGSRRSTDVGGMKRSDNNGFVRDSPSQCGRAATSIPQRGPTALEGGACAKWGLPVQPYATVFLPSAEGSPACCHGPCATRHESPTGAPTVAASWVSEQDAVEDRMDDDCDNSEAGSDGRGLCRHGGSRNTDGEEEDDAPYRSAEMDVDGGEHPHTRTVDSQGTADAHRSGGTGAGRSILSLSMSCSESPLLCFLSDCCGGAWIALAGDEEELLNAECAILSGGVRGSACNENTASAYVHPFLLKCAQAKALTPLIIPQTSDIGQSIPTTSLRRPQHMNTEVSPIGQGYRRRKPHFLMPVVQEYCLHDEAITASNWDPLNSPLLAIGRHDGAVKLIDINYTCIAVDKVSQGKGLCGEMDGQGIDSAAPPMSEATLPYGVLRERALLGGVTALDWVPQSRITVVAAKQRAASGYFAEVLDLRSPECGVTYLGLPPSALQHSDNFSESVRRGGSSGGRGRVMESGAARGYSTRAVCYAEHLACDALQRYVATVGPQRERDVLQLWDLRVTSNPVEQEVLKRARYTSLVWQDGSSDLSVFATTHDGQLRCHTFLASAGPGRCNRGGGGHWSTVPGAALGHGLPLSRTLVGAVGGAVYDTHPFFEDEYVDHREPAGGSHDEDDSLSGTEAGAEDLMDAQSRQSTFSEAVSGPAVRRPVSGGDDEGGGDREVAVGDSIGGKGGGRCEVRRWGHEKVRPALGEKFQVHAKVPTSKVAWLPSFTLWRQLSRALRKGAKGELAYPSAAAATEALHFSERPVVRRVESGGTMDLDALLLLNVRDGELYFQVFSKFTSTVAIFRDSVSLLAAGPNVFFSPSATSSGNGSGHVNELFSSSITVRSPPAPTQISLQTTCERSPLLYTESSMDGIVHSALTREDWDSVLGVPPIPNARLAKAMGRAQEGFGADPLVNLGILARSADDREAYIIFRYGILATAHFYPRPRDENCQGERAKQEVRLPSTAALPGVMECLQWEVHRFHALWNIAFSATGQISEGIPGDVLRSVHVDSPLSIVGKRYCIHEIRSLILRAMGWDADDLVDKPYTRQPSSNGKINRSNAVTNDVTAVRPSGTEKTDQPSHTWPPTLIESDVVEVQSETEALERRVAILIITGRLMEAAQLLALWRHLRDVYPALSMLLTTFTSATQSRRQRRPQNASLVQRTSGNQDLPRGMISSSISRNILSLADALTPWLRLSLLLLHKRNTAYQKQLEWQRAQREERELQRQHARQAESVLYSPFMDGVPGAAAPEHHIDHGTGPSFPLSNAAEAQRAAEEAQDANRDAPQWTLAANQSLFVEAVCVHPDMAASDRLALAAALLLPDPAAPCQIAELTEERQTPGGCDYACGNQFVAGETLGQQQQRQLLHLLAIERAVVLEPLQALLSVCDQMLKRNPGALFNTVFTGLGTGADLLGRPMSSQSFGVYGGVHGTHQLQLQPPLSATSSAATAPPRHTASIGVSGSSTEIGSHARPSSIRPNATTALGTYTPTVDTGGMTRSLQMYVDVSGDVQLPTCFAASFGPAQSARWEMWNGAYRAWLNGNSLHVARCRHDLGCLKGFKARDAVATLRAYQNSRSTNGGGCGAVGSFGGSAAMAEGSAVSSASATASASMLAAVAASGNSAGSVCGGNGVVSARGFVGPTPFDVYGTVLMPLQPMTSPFVVQAMNPSRSVELRCGCGQAMHTSAPGRKAATTIPIHGAVATSAQRRQLMPCQNPECRRVETPICTVCSERMESRLTDLPPDMWFVWCASCLHGGHLTHWKDWFHKHSKCPVEDCECHCRL